MSYQREDLESFKRELEKAEEWKQTAYNRMKRQSAAGDLYRANLSRRAFEYCKKYADQLRHIIEGRRKSKSGLWFTKESGHRFKKPDH